MIYFTTNNKEKHILVLGPGNLDMLKAGKPTSSPDGEVLVIYCPDVDRLFEMRSRFVGSHGVLDTDKLDEILQESLKWPEVRMKKT